MNQYYICKFGIEPASPKAMELYCIVLNLRGGHCCPVHCDLSKIYCASPNLGITRT